MQFNGVVVFCSSAMMFAVGVGASLDVSVLKRQVRRSETSGWERADGAAGRRPWCKRTQCVTLAADGLQLSDLC